MGWLRLVGFFKLQVSFAKEPYKRDLYSAKWLIILRSLLTVATPYIYPFYQPHSLSSQCFSDVRTMAQHACGVQYIWYFFPVFFSIRCISAHNHCMSLWHCSTTGCITSAQNSSKVSSTFCMVLADFWETIPQKSAVHFVWYFESQLYICMVFHHCICMILHHILYGISIVSSTFVWYFMTVVNFWQQLVHTIQMIHMYTHLELTFEVPYKMYSWLLRNFWLLMTFVDFESQLYICMLFHDCCQFLPAAGACHCSVVAALHAPSSTEIYQKSALHFADAFICLLIFFFGEFPPATAACRRGTVAAPRAPSSASGPRARAVRVDLHSCHWRRGRR